MYSAVATPIVTSTSQAAPCPPLTWCFLFPPQVEEWFERAAKFSDLAKQVKRMANRLNRVKNRSLLYDVYPYVWDMCGVVGLLNSYVDWLGTPTSAHAYNTPPCLDALYNPLFHPHNLPLHCCSSVCPSLSLLSCGLLLLLLVSSVSSCLPSPVLC